MTDWQRKIIEGLWMSTVGLVLLYFVDRQMFNELLKGLL